MSDDAGTTAGRLADPFDVREVEWKRLKRGASAEDRFWNFVVKSTAPGGCWYFLGSAVNRIGHRVLRVGKKTVLAHRYSWSIHRGDPGLLCVLHACDNPACVRPDHLFLGTRADNNADMDRKGRRRPHVGERNRLSKLTDRGVVEIRRLRVEEGLSMASLGARFGVSVTTIQKLLAGLIWRHVS